MGSTGLVYKGVKFDSDEEVYVAMWFEELKQHNLVKEWKRPIESIPLTNGLKRPYEKITQLKTKIKKEQKTLTLLRPSEYTPDFYVKFTIDGYTKLISGIYTCINPKAIFFSRQIWNEDIPFEIKPSFDQNNMERLFVNNQKFIWDKLQIFVNLIEPIELFKKTFLPKEAEKYFKYKVISKKAMAKGKKKGDFKFDWQPKTIKQFLYDNKNNA